MTDEKTILLSERFSERFEKYVEFGPDCWRWSGFKNEHGYGRLKVGTRNVLAHRVAWMIQNPDHPLKDGECVLHRCDNPPCVRPDHLFVGTQLDNIRDRNEKGRTAKAQPRLRGERNHLAKMRDEDIPEVRRRLACGETCKSIARDYGVARRTINHIKLGGSWTYVAR